MQNTNIPAHVPRHLVREYNFFDTEGAEDVYLYFKKKLHDGPDIFYSTCHGGHWVATRYKDMEAILGNAGDFSSRHSTIPKNPALITLLEFDGSIHTDFRKLLAPYFTPRNIGRLEQVSRNLTNALIDDFYGRGECDFVEEFSQKMPIMILMSLLGLPMEDTSYLMPISDDIVRSGTPEIQDAAFKKLHEYIATGVIPKRRAKPGDDIFSTVLQGAVQGGRPVTDQEVVGMGSLLIAAGLDTVAGMLGFIALFLSGHPAHRQQLRDDPDLINPALEEMMRRHHISNLARVATRDIPFNGVQIKAGECVLLPTTVAGLDERRYPDPMTVDFHRPDKKNLVFGRGPHQCIGAFLARTELRVFLQEWTRRIPDFSLQSGERPRMVAGKANAIRYLPLTWNV